MIVPIVVIVILPLSLQKAFLPCVLSFLPQSSRANVSAYHLSNHPTASKQKFGGWLDKTLRANYDRSMTPSSPNLTSASPSVSKYS